MASETEPDADEPVITRDRKTGLPLIKCKRAASPQEEATPDRVAEILLTQEAEWHATAG